MKNIWSTSIYRSLFCIAFLAATVGLVSAAPNVRNVAGASPAAIQTVVDQFRAEFGALNPNFRQTFPGGRREINWDTTPPNISSGGVMSGTTFNSTLNPRGVVIGTPTSNIGNDQFNLLVSGNAAAGPVRFGDIEPSYAANFQPFSGEQIAAVRSTSANSTAITIQFFLPGTSIPAAVKGFGIVFCDVDHNQNVMIRVYGPDGHQLMGTSSVTAANNGLSFFGVTFNAGERIAQVEILAGNAPLKTGNLDGVNGLDLIAMDDLIYGEPHSILSHPADYDGDGATDIALLSGSLWFIRLSGTGEILRPTFGQIGDLPIDGDFDGDGMTDLAVFRPSTAEWIIKKSASGEVATTQFGTQLSRPVPGDYDKDGKTDIAIYSLPNGDLRILRSSDGVTASFLAGSPFDIPVAAAADKLCPTN